jgi:DnaK suppressor protein
LIFLFIFLEEKFAMPVSTNQVYRAKEGELYMGPEQATYFKGLLEAERTRCIEVQNRIVSEVLQKKTGRLSSDTADTANQEVELRSALRGREYRLIKKINSALTRLEAKDGRYGFCDACNGQIGIQRLEVRPTATLCFDCKTLDEIREKRDGYN